MIEKKHYIILVLILAIFIGCVFMVIVQNESLVIGNFEFGDYYHYVENFPSEENVGQIIDGQDAIKKAEIIWIKLYGQEIKKEKPFKVFYDAQNEIWLVRGTLPPNAIGGVANVLIENDTGKVLAVWHDK